MNLHHIENYLYQTSMNDSMLNNQEIVNKIIKGYKYFKQEETDSVTQKIQNFLGISVKTQVAASTLARAQTRRYTFF